MSKIQTLDFINFLKKPTLEPNSKFKKSWLFWLVLISGTQFLAFLLGFIASTVLVKLGFEGQNSVQEAVLNYPIWLFILLASVQAPITEEMAFRLFLKPSYWRWVIAFFGFTFYAQQLLPSDSPLLSYKIFPSFNHLTSPLINSFVLSLILGLIWKYYPKFRLNLESFFKQKFVWFFYLSAFTFGAIHIQNYSGLNQLWWLAPFLVIPQTLIGLVIGYLRVKMGFKWGVLAHSFYNTVTALPIIILSFLPKEIILRLVDSSKSDETSKILTGLSPAQNNLILLSGAVFMWVAVWNLFCFIWLIRAYRQEKKNTSFL
jgi:hypothetical protein